MEEKARRTVGGFKNAGARFSTKWILTVLAALVGVAVLVMLTMGSALIAALSAFFVITVGCGLAAVQGTKIRYDANEASPIARFQTASSLLSSRESGSPSTWWVQKGVQQPAPAEALRTFCVTKSHHVGLLAEVAEHIVKNGGSIDMTNNLETAVSAITDQPLRWDTLFVDLDDCEEHTDLQTLLDELSWFRKVAPEVKVVICSLLFGRDDWGTDRLTLADVSIRKPCSLSRLLQCIPIAHENNRAWRRRLQNMSTTASLRSV